MVKTLSYKKKEDHFRLQLCISGPSVLTYAGSIHTVCTAFASYHTQHLVAPVSYRTEKIEIQKEFAERNEKRRAHRTCAAFPSMYVQREQ